MFDFKDYKRNRTAKGLESSFHKDLEQVSDLSRLKRHIAKYSTLDFDNNFRINLKKEMKKDVV